MEAELNRIYRDTKYKAADKVQALEMKYMLDALESRGYKKLDVGSFAAKKDTAQVTGLSQTMWVMNGEGKIIAVSDFIKTKFSHNYELSPDVWQTDAIEARVNAVIDGGRALGRDIVEIGKDLQTLIKYKDGGERVIGRWGAQMGSAYKVDGTRDDKKIQESWEREYIQKWNEDMGFAPEHEGYIGYGSKDAQYLLGKGEAQAWIKTNSISDKTGRVLLPPGARAYSSRIGKAGLDYRAVRKLRSDSHQSFCDRMYEQTQTSPASTGKVRRVLAQHRDAWGCECVKAARWINSGEGKNGKTIQQIKAENSNWLAPMHPNCECYDEPILLSQDELIEKILGKKEAVD